MTINLELKNAGARLAVLLLALAAGTLLLVIVFSRFVVGTLADDRFMLERDWLLAGTAYLPDSPRLNARLAEVELFAADPDLNRADTVAGSDPRRRLQLAQFLVRQSRVVEAATIFRSIDRAERLASIESAQLLNALIAAGNTAIAHELWVSLVSEGNTGGALVYNGGF